MENVVTFDHPMIRNWAFQRAAIEQRFDAMRKELSFPYSQASLPQVLRPERVVVS